MRNIVNHEEVKEILNKFKEIYKNETCSYFIDHHLRNFLYLNAPIIENSSFKTTQFPGPYHNIVISKENLIIIESFLDRLFLYIIKHQKENYQNLLNTYFIDIKFEVATYTTIAENNEFIVKKPDSLLAVKEVGEFFSNCLRTASSVPNVYAFYNKINPIQSFLIELKDNQIIQEKRINNQSIEVTDYHTINELTPHISTNDHSLFFAFLSSVLSLIFASLFLIPNWTSILYTTIFIIISNTIMIKLPIQINLPILRIKYNKIYIFLIFLTLGIFNYIVSAKSVSFISQKSSPDNKHNSIYLDVSNLIKNNKDIYLARKEFLQNYENKKYQLDSTVLNEKAIIFKNLYIKSINDNFFMNLLFQGITISIFLFAIKYKLFKTNKLSSFMILYQVMFQFFIIAEINPEVYITTNEELNIAITNNKKLKSIPINEFNHYVKKQHE